VQTAQASGQWRSEANAEPGRMGGNPHEEDKRAGHDARRWRARARPEDAAAGPPTPPRAWRRLPPPARAPGPSPIPPGFGVAQQLPALREGYCGARLDAGLPSGWRMTGQKGGHAGGHRPRVPPAEVVGFGRRRRQSVDVVGVGDSRVVARVAEQAGNARAGDTAHPQRRRAE